MLYVVWVMCCNFKVVLIVVFDIWGEFDVWKCKIIFLSVIKLDFEGEEIWKDCLFVCILCSFLYEVDIINKSWFWCFVDKDGVWNCE